MKKVQFIIRYSLFAALLSACDLQPKIASIPDSVGGFISDRYPALLADPKTQPEIYNSAVSDYGVYANVSLYGTPEYANASDYSMPAQDAGRAASGKSGYLLVPEKKKNSEIGEITVEKGDTLYSVSRKHNMPVNELAVLNGLSAPFALSVGQKLKVKEQIADNREQIELARLQEEQKRLAAEKEKVAQEQKKIRKQQENAKTEQQWLEAEKQKQAAEKKQAELAKKQDDVKKAEAVQKEKISSAPRRAITNIAPRAGAKFSWPVASRRIISDYGAKSNGLFNDGINIAASAGAAVLAAENGTIAYAGNEVKGMGNLVIIQHAGGWMSVYTHLDSMDVRRGRRVSAGDKIGSVGKTGKVSEPQLHFEIRKGSKAYNPISQLKK